LLLSQNNNGTCSGAEILATWQQWRMLYKFLPYILRTVFSCHVSPATYWIRPLGPPLNFWRKYLQAGSQRGYVHTCLRSISLQTNPKHPPPSPTTPSSRRLGAAVSAMNAVYRRNGLPLAAFIHCLAESPVHDADLDKDNRMEVFAASDSLGTLSSQ
jgi:hypothetical protein